MTKHISGTTNTMPLPCVEHKKRIFSIDPFWFTIILYSPHFIMPPDIDTIIPVDLNIQQGATLLNQHSLSLCSSCNLLQISWYWNHDLQTCILHGLSGAGLHVSPFISIQVGPKCLTTMHRGTTCPLKTKVRLTLN